MSIRIQIPKVHVEALGLLASQSAKEYAVIKSRFVGLTEGGESPTVEQLESFITGISDDAERAMVQALIGLFMFRMSEDDLGNEFKDEFKAAYVSQSSDEASADNLVKRISELFELSGALRCTLKGVNLVRETEHLYKDSRVLSDIRPVFVNSKAELNGNHAVLLHRLKLEYEDADNFRDIFLTLTRKQLEELKTVVERAIDKDAQIREHSNFKFVD